MKPKPRSEASQLDLFQAQLEQLLNLTHPLCVLAGKMDWIASMSHLRIVTARKPVAPEKTSDCLLDCMT